MRLAVLAICVVALAVLLGQTEAKSTANSPANNKIEGRVLSDTAGGKRPRSSSS